jgi:alpha-ketoglutarate-dependent taurine dioxygenase
MTAPHEPPYTVRPLAPSFGALVEARGERAPTELDPAEIARLFVNSGALVFRGFQVGSPRFLELTSMYCGAFMTYQGGGIRFGPLDRQSIGGNPTLLTTTGHTQGFAMDLHGEMYYLKRRPEVLWFYCETAPARAGETTLCDGRELLGLLPAETRRFLETRRLRYIRRLGEGDWQTAFQTQSLDEVRRICDENETALRLLPGGQGIETEFSDSALRTSPTVRAEVFINSLVLIHGTEQAFESGWVKEKISSMGARQCPMVVRLEDGSRLPDAMIEEIRRLSKKILLPHAWQKGDILMIDNTRVLHGRKDAAGAERVIYVRMAEAGPPIRAAMERRA